MAQHWPVVLRQGDVSLRPLRVSDHRQWQQLRADNHTWLVEWDATAPYPSTDPPPTFRQSVRRMRRDARRGTHLPFVVEFQGEFVGQINVSDIVYGSLRGCHIGYWISQRVAGRGIMTVALALVTDYLFDVVRLHRIEIGIRPENEPSNRLVRRVGYHYEGTREKFLHINNDWRDHHIYALRSDQRIAPLAPKFGAPR